MPKTVVVVPLRVPLKIESLTGFGVGVIVLLPITILGTAAEGKTVVDGALVVDPGEGEINGTDCCNGGVSHEYFNSSDTTRDTGRTCLIGRGRLTTDV